MIATTSCRGTLRPPIKIHGGKHPIANWIVSLMPEHRFYVEPFVGGGSVYLSVPTASGACCVYDANPRVIRMWAVLRSWPRELQRVLRLVPYHESVWRDAAGRLDDPDAVIAAASLIIRSRMSRGGLGKHFGVSTRLRGGKNEYLNAWETFRDHDLPKICERAEWTVMDCRDFRKVFPKFDGNDALIYCDPPYHPETRTVRKAYDAEMSHEDHVDLLDLALDVDAKVMISGYRCGLYDDRLKSWNRHDKAVANHAGQGKTKQRRIESVWCNF